MKKIVLSAAACVAIGGFAMAGGDIAPVAPAPMDSWSGFYVGVQAGGVWGDADVDYQTDTQSYGYYKTYGLNVDGFAGGLYAGYNWLLQDNWLVGVEGEWNYVSADDTGAVVNDPTTTTKVEQNWDASLRVRAGKVIGDSLFYITGGIAWGDFDLAVYDASDRGSGSYTLTGWTLGAGWEYRFSEHLSARIQYRYTDYGDDTKRVWSQPPSYIDAKLNYNSHMVMVGFSYRF